MRVTIDQMKVGIAKYIDNEIAAKISGFGKWVIPLAGASLINGKLDAIIKQNHEALKQLGYMTEDHMVELDKLYTDAKKIAMEKGSVTEHFPLLGDITFSAADIDALKRYIG